MNSAESLIRPKTSKRTASGLGGIEFYTLRDAKQLLRRRIWLIVSVALALGLVVSAIAYALPNQYQASALIMVDPGKVPESYVKPTATIDAKQRLAILQEQILSDTRLSQVIQEQDLYRSLRNKMTQSDIVDMMRSRIDVQTQTASGPVKTLKTFTVAFTAQSPVVAAKVSNRLASLFIEENLKVRAQQVVGTADFFEAQIQKAKQDLDQRTQTLAQIRSKYASELPESQNLHLQALTSAQMSLREEEDAKTRAEQQKKSVQTLLASSPNIVDLDSTGSATAAGLQEQLERLQTEMDQLRARYGPSYPDVRIKSADIDVVKSKLTEVEKQGKTARATDKKTQNPALESQIAQIDDEIRKHTVRQAELASQIKFHESALQRVPAAQQELTSATNDVSAAADRYKRLEDRKFAADMFSDVESRQQGERFVLLDVAQPPPKPVSPQRALIDGIGIGAGLLVALLVVVILELVNPAVKTELEIRERLGVPVFGEIPRISTMAETQRRRVRMAFLLTANLVLAVAFCGVIVASITK